MPQPHLDAADEIADARQSLNLIELATRYNPGEPDSDRAAINAACFTARHKLEAAMRLLKSAPAVDMADCPPLPAAAGESDIIRLYCRFKEISAAAEAYDGEGIEDIDAQLDRLFYNERDRVENALMALPCKTPADFAVKVIVATCKGQVLADWNTGPIWAEARDLIGGAA